MSVEPRHLRIDVAYDGTEFAGWQVQAKGERTVQGVLEQTVSRLQGGCPLRVRGAGRTDAGVHARAQVVDCDLATDLSDAELLRSLRAILPPDLRATAVCTTDAAFDSRSDALEKTYVYRLDRSLHGDPFLRRYALHHPHRLDPTRAESALARLRGRRAGPRGRAPSTRWPSSTG